MRFNKNLLCDEYSLVASKLIFFVDDFPMELILIKPASGYTLGIYRTLAFKECKFLNGKSDILVIWIARG